MKRFRFESFIKFIIESPKYGTFTEAARTDPEQYSHDTWREEFVERKAPFKEKITRVDEGYRWMCSLEVSIKATWL